MHIYIYIYIITESRQRDVFIINCYKHKLKHLIFWHSCAFHQCERTNVQYIYVSPFTLMKGTGVPENYVFSLVLIKVDYKDITLSRLCYYLSQSTRGTNTKTMFFSPYIYI